MIVDKQEHKDMLMTILKGIPAETTLGDVLDGQIKLSQEVVDVYNAVKNATVAEQDKPEQDE